MRHLGFLFLSICLFICCIFSFPLDVFAAGDDGSISNSSVVTQSLLKPVKKWRAYISVGGGIGGLLVQDRLSHIIGQGASGGLINGYISGTFSFSGGVDWIIARRFILGAELFGRIFAGNVLVTPNAGTQSNIQNNINGYQMLGGQLKPTFILDRNGRAELFFLIGVGVMLNRIYNSSSSQNWTNLMMSYGVGMSFILPKTEHAAFFFRFVGGTVFNTANSLFPGSTDPSEYYLRMNAYGFEVGFSFVT